MGVILNISEQEVQMDKLGRTVTTLTQEVMLKLTFSEAETVKAILKALDSTDLKEEYITYNLGDTYTSVEITGTGVNKLIKTFNTLYDYIKILPKTKIQNSKTYLMQLDY